MSHVSLTGSLSHRLYCPVLSLCHLCVHSAGSGWEWISITCSLSHRLYSPVLSLCHVCPLCRQWMGMSHVSLTCSLSLILYCPVLLLCHLCVFTLRQCMGMSHVSLTCSLSHRLSCHVLSSFHLCAQSAGSGWEWVISLPLAVCQCIVSSYFVVSCMVLLSSAVRDIRQ